MLLLVPPFVPPVIPPVTGGTTMGGTTETPATSQQPLPKGSGLL